jgi:hypothetical protein
MRNGTVNAAGECHSVRMDSGADRAKRCDSAERLSKRWSAGAVICHEDVGSSISSRFGLIGWNMLGRLFIASLALTAVACGNSTAALPTAPTAAPSNVTGLVDDSIGRPLPGAQVTVAVGPLTGRSTTSDTNGRFAFAALTAGTESVALLVSKEGYTTVVATAGKKGDVSVSLTAQTLPDITGEYRLSVTADSACSDLPPDRRTRTYAASIKLATSPARVVVTLNGAAFSPGDTRFLGLLATDAAQFWVSRLNPDDEDLPIVEQLDASTYLSWYGTATAAIQTSGAPIAATFAGTIAYCPDAKPSLAAQFAPTCAVALVECQSRTHQLTFTPQ